MGFWRCRQLRYCRLTGSAGSSGIAGLPEVPVYRLTGSAGSSGIAGLPEVPANARVSYAYVLLWLPLGSAGLPGVPAYRECRLTGSAGLGYPGRLDIRFLTQQEIRRTPANARISYAYFLLWQPLGHAGSS